MLCYLPQRKFLTRKAMVKPFWLVYHHFRSQTLRAFLEIRMFLGFTLFGRKPGISWKIPLSDKWLCPWQIQSWQEYILCFYLETSDFNGLKSMFSHEISLSTEISGKSLLLWSVEMQNPAMTLFLIESGADPESRNSQGWPVLVDALEKAWHETGSSRCFEVVKVLLENGAEANLVDRQGDPAALTALKMRNLPLFRLLVEHGADVNPRDGTKSMLAAAVRMEFTEVIRFLFERGAEMTRDSSGQPLLHSAILANNQEIVELLLAHGADSEERDENGETPFLLNAGSHCSEGIAEALLKSGADINERLPDGNGVLHIGLYDFDEERDSRWLAFLLDHGADIEMQDDEGVTPFEFALQLEKLPLMDFLLSHGVNPNGPGGDVMPPLMKTVIKNQPQSAELLLKHHANPTIRCGRESPLEYVIKRGSPEMKQIFRPFFDSTLDERDFPVR